MIKSAVRRYEVVGSMPDGINHSTTAPIYLTVEISEFVRYIKDGFAVILRW